MKRIWILIFVIYIATHAYRLKPSVASRSHPKIPLQLYFDFNLKKIRIQWHYIILFANLLLGPEVAGSRTIAGVICSEGAAFSIRSEAAGRV